MCCIWFYQYNSLVFLLASLSSVSLASGSSFTIGNPRFFLPGLRVSNCVTPFHCIERLVDQFIGYSRIGISHPQFSCNLTYKYPLKTVSQEGGERVKPCEVLTASERNTSGEAVERISSPR